MNGDPSMLIPSHSEIISILTTFFSLLDTLAAIEPCLATHFSPLNTSIYPPMVFDADTARAAGFDAETVEVLSALPCFNVRDHEMHTALQPNTYPTSYPGTHLNDHDFSCRREVLEGAWEGPSAIPLTWEESGSGLVHIYDTRTRLVTLRRYWGYAANDSVYLHVPAVPPGEAF